MSAATVTAATANADSIFRQIKTIQNKKTVKPLAPQGLYYIDTGAVAFATTQIDDINDETYVLQFPQGCYLVGSSLEVTYSDMDTHVTPTLAFDVKTDDGSTEVTLISNSTGAQTGTYDQADADLGFQLKDVSGLYLNFKVKTAASTAAAGTVRVRCLVFLGDKVTLS